MTDYAQQDRLEKFLKIIEGKEAPAIAGPNLTPEQQRKVLYVTAAQFPCLLCDDEPYAVGKWLIPEALGAPGEVYYALCEVCIRLPGKEALINKALADVMSGKGETVQ